MVIADFLEVSRSNTCGGTLSSKVCGLHGVLVCTVGCAQHATLPYYILIATNLSVLSYVGVRYDSEMAAVRGAVEKVVLDLVTGTRSTADIKRALLSHAQQLALFFGRRDINDLLLPLLITCLNAPEWQLRGAFFGAVASIGEYTGRESLDVFLLPCLEQVRGLTGVCDNHTQCLDVPD